MSISTGEIALRAAGTAILTVILGRASLLSLGSQKHQISRKPLLSGISTDLPKQYFSWIFSSIIRVRAYHPTMCY